MMDQAGGLKRIFLRKRVNDNMTEYRTIINGIEVKAVYSDEAFFSENIAFLQVIWYSNIGADCKRT